MKTLISAVLLIALAVFLLCVKIIFKKGGRFPSGHVHDLPHLKEKGVGCAGAEGAYTKRRSKN